ncbi:MAG: hypothetical protein COC19_05995, partial [SAR86 cluster bacterium]
MNRPYSTLISLLAGLSLLNACNNDAMDDSAVSLDGLGSLSFETSCKAEVAAQFNRAVALLHSFEYDG